MNLGKTQLSVRKGSRFSLEYFFNFKSAKILPMVFLPLWVFS